MKHLILILTLIAALGSEVVAQRRISEYPVGTSERAITHKASVKPKRTVQPQIVSSLILKDRQTHNIQSIGLEQRYKRHKRRMSEDRDYNKMNPPIAGYDSRAYHDDIMGQAADAAKSNQRIQEARRRVENQAQQMHRQVRRSLDLQIQNKIMRVR